MFLGPLFTIYILRTLKLSNFILSLCMVSWWIANVLASKYWGDYSKENGNLKILKINTLVLSLLPILWIASYYLQGTLQIVFILIINLFAGITFSGFSLASFNLVYELVEKDDVVKYSSLLYLGEGTSIFLGSIMAGSIVDSIYINNIVSNVNFTSIPYQWKQEDDFFFANAKLCSSLLRNRLPYLETDFFLLFFDLRKIIVFFIISFI